VAFDKKLITDRLAQSNYSPLRRKELFKAHCKVCHAEDAEAGEYTPMSLIMDQWDEFFDDTYPETHQDLACPKGEEKKLAMGGHTVHYDGYHDQARAKANTKILIPEGMKLSKRINTAEVITRSSTATSTRTARDYRRPAPRLLRLAERTTSPATWKSAMARMWPTRLSSH